MGRGHQSATHGHLASRKQAGLTCALPRDPSPSRVHPPTRPQAAQARAARYAHLPAAHARRAAQHGVQEAQQHAAQGRGPGASRLSEGARWVSLGGVGWRERAPRCGEARRGRQRRHVQACRALPPSTTSQPAYKQHCKLAKCTPEHEHGLGADHLLSKVGNVGAVNAGAARRKRLGRRLCQPAGGGG